MKEAVEARGRMVYDGTLLANMYSTSNSDRTGVFFVVYNTFLQLMKQDLYQVVVYADDDKKKDVERAIDDLGYLDVRVVGTKDLQNEKFDIYLSPFAPPPDCVAHSTAAKYMILHDVTPLALPEIEAPNQRWYEKLEQSLNGEDYYFANSEYTKRDFLRFYPALDPSHIKVGYLAASEKFYHCDDKDKIDEIKRKYGVPLDVPYIFSLCTLQPRKNLVHAVKCFAKFIRENDIDDLCFVLGGGHWDEFNDILDHEAESLGSVKSRIITTGCIEDDDLAMLYSGAMFTVYVSLYEGFGLPVLEAMQCGCPVITSSVTSMPEVIGDTGITVDPRDPVELRKAYKKMYTDSSFRESCSKKGMERAHGFSWESFINTVLSGINETWEQAVADNKQKLRAAGRSKKKARNRIHWFGKVWTEQRTTVYVLGIPVARKDKFPDKHVIKIFGIPLIKKVFYYYAATTYLGPIPVKKRPNYAYIESQIDLYTGSFGHALLQLKSRIDALQGRQIDDMKSLFNDKIRTVQMYQLIKAVERGDMTLENELRQIGSQMERNALAEEGEIE